VRAAERTRLRHDVARYLTRAACNARNGPIPPALGALLVDDLYVSPTGGRPSARFAEVEDLLPPEVAARIRALFDEIDALERRVRDLDEHALRCAADAALGIAALIDDATAEDAP
jgi:hypothetical protein